MKDTIALVTGSSRGVGKGIAHELGIAGATVYITGRSREGGKSTDNLPGTIEETADLVTKSGGKGIPVHCDHTSEEDVKLLASTIKKEHGKLDILVNNVWGGYEQYDPKMFGLPIWEQPVWRWDQMMNSGVRAHYMSVKFCSALLVESKKALNVHISFGDEEKFLSDVQYDVAKYSCSRLAIAVAARLKEEQVTSVAVFPGFTSTERVIANISKDVLAQTHTPRFVGRAIVHLYNDPMMISKSGKSFSVGELGKEYGFKDVDGRVIEPFRI